MSNTDLKDLVRSDLNELKVKEQKENQEKNSKLKETILYIGDNSPMIDTFKNSLEHDGIKYVEKKLKDHPSVGYITQNNAQIVAFVNDNYLCHGRDFNNPKQLSNMLQTYASPDYVKPNTEELVIEAIKNLNSNMGRAFQNFSRQLAPVIRVMSQLAEEEETEIKPTNAKKNK